MRNSLAWKIGSLIPDDRKKEFIHHTYMEMVSQRIGQILCGYEDANDCNRLRSDSALKMSCGRKPSDADLSSQPTMTRLENNIGSKTLYRIGKLFLDEYISSFDKAPKKIIVDADDTNANTYGAQQLTLLSMVDKQKRRAENDYLKAQKVENDRYETLKRLKYPDVRHERIVIRRYYKLEYKAQSWNLEQGQNLLYPYTMNRH